LSVLQQNRNIIFEYRMCNLAKKLNKSLATETAANVLKDETKNIVKESVNIVVAGFFTFRTKQPIS